MGPIIVGHVEVEDLWIEIPSEGPLSVSEVISRSGMSPRDGTRVRCFQVNGDSVPNGRVMPGETVIIGSRPPTRTGQATLHENVTIRWERDIVSYQRGISKTRRFNGSGWVDGGCTLWVPGVAQDSQIRAVELSRKKNSNGKFHAQGYRVRSDDEPYMNGDLVLAHSNDEMSMRIFDPITESLSVDVRIDEKSLEATFRSEMNMGHRPTWVLRISSFDPLERTAKATVERGYTWWRY